MRQCKLLILKSGATSRIFRGLIKYIARHKNLIGTFISGV
jgi:hypothetical protein